MNKQNYRGFEIGTKVDGTVYARKGAKWLESADVAGVKVMVDAVLAFYGR